MIGESEPGRDLPGRRAARRDRWPIVGVAGLTLVILGASIVLAQLHLRKRLFEQIAQRDGETLEQVAAVQFADDKANDESVTTLEDPSEQIQLALKISSSLHSVLGVRLFTPDGQFLTAAPAYITETEVSKEDMEQLRAFRGISHFTAEAQLKDQDLLAETNSPSIPLLTVLIPLHEEGSTRLAGIAQFLVHGSGIAAEYRQLDKNLVTQGAIIFAVSGTLITMGLMLAFRRVQRANRLLAERTQSLLHANRELALAAKTSAIGAVTSHLIHGLKNPLGGLRSFVQDRAQEQQAGPDNDWELAAATTQRMQNLIDRVVRVLQEQQTGAEYELSLNEFVEILNSRVGPAAAGAGVEYHAEVAAGGILSNREADLLLLILENLVQNAIEATPEGAKVWVRAKREESNVVIEVEDQGPGLKPELIARLFSPCTSSKKGGSGIGLAISRQLAVHLGAVLDLKNSSREGCCFRLVVPLDPAPGLGQRDLPLGAVENAK